VDGLQSRLLHVRALEGVKCEQDVIDALIEVSNGDMRRAITYLQSIHRLYGNEINVESVYLVSGNVPKVSVLFTIIYSIHFAEGYR
jgi:replication factor C subunit 2/4